MKKMKKMLAMLLALTMVLGMSLTALADEPDKADIIVSEAVGAELFYLQVIEPDETSATGWKFSTDDIAEDYKTAFGITDEQIAIAMLIRNQIPNEGDLPAGTPSIIVNATAATSTQIQHALDNVINSENFDLKFEVSATDNTKQVATVDKAGVYAIKATAEAGNTYKAMSGYVGFGTVTAEDETIYNYPALEDESVTAKKIPTTILKNDKDADDITQIGATVTYEIETKFPYFNKNHTSKYFAISDSLTGAKYNEGSFVVKVGDQVVDLDSKENAEDVEYNFDMNAEKNYFIIDLSSYILEDNANAEKDVTIEYTVEVTAVEVGNTATSHIDDKTVKSDPVKVFTGYMTLTKTNDDGSVVLADAHFNLTLKDQTTLYKFKERAPKVGEDQETRYYTFTADVDYEGEYETIDGQPVLKRAATTLITGSNGKLVVEGLDEGEYHFAEIKAPKGYSINEEGVDATLLLVDEDNTGEVDESIATAVFTTNDATVSIRDTKLLALPSTGGIGTTIFTVMGCVIMIGAAGLFFVNRRKNA